MASRILFLCVALAWSDRAVLAADIAIEIASKHGMPTSVIVQQAGKPSAAMTPVPPNVSIYSHEFPKQATAVWVVRSVVIASWSDARQELRLRVTEKMDRPVAVKILHTRPVADANTLRRMENVGTHFDGLLERYFSARDVYRTINSPTHPVAIQALKIWYDAAFELCRQYNFIECDTEVMDKVRNLESAADTDPALKKKLRLWFKEGYVKAMNDQLRTLEWRDVALVGSEIQNGRPENAALINQHFVQRYSRLSAEDQKRITRMQGIDGKLLQGNTRLLNTLLNR